MNIVHLNDTVAVTEQITEADISAIAAAGFKVLINNRPDGEVADQPSGSAIADAAAAAGLAYYHLPVTAANFPGPDVKLMETLLNNSEEPVLAFCRTGTRCTNLWVCTRPPSALEEAREKALALGFDLRMASSAP